MHTVDLIAASIPDDDPDRPSIDEIRGLIRPGVCAVTGEMCDTVPREWVIKKGFTSIGLLMSPESDRIGINAYIAMGYKYERMSSWICDGIFRRLKRTDVRKEVLAYRNYDDPWAAYATTSYKKHGALKAKINYPGQYRWLFENYIVDCSDREKVMHYWGVLNESLRLGFGRRIIETLDCPVSVIKKIGFKAWMEFKLWAKPKYKTRLYSFLCYLLPSQEEIKNERESQDTMELAGRAKFF